MNSPSASEQLSIIVSGMVAGQPHQGGATWAVLQYVLGLRDLGHRVTLIEPVEAIPSPSAAYFDELRKRFELDGAAALVVRGTRDTVGLPYARLVELAREADLLINISGMLQEPALVEPIPRRVYLDLDPAFNQLWHVQGIDAGLAGHSHYVTIGMKLGTPECPIPLCDQNWITTWQPIVLAQWPVAPPTDVGGLNGGALSTIANWRGYGSIEHNGVHYGQKAHSFRQFFDLPTRTRESFLLALSIDSGETNDLAQLAQYGWPRVDPSQVTGTPDAYQKFIQRSKGEFGVAKSGYVISRCGWFSDRSIAYLASGRPVLAQATGFEDLLPVGAGLLSFSTMEDLLAAIDALNADYNSHRLAARGLAEAYFDSNLVLPRLLDQLGGAP